MKRWWRRILWTLAAAVAACGLYLWSLSPQVMAVLEAHKIARRCPYVRMVPLTLPDTSTSTATGNRITYLGYDFEVPWNDLDESKTTVSPTRVVLHSRSGQTLMLTSLPPREFVGAILKEFDQDTFRQVYGERPLQSDYEMQRLILESTPDAVTIFSSQKEAVRSSMLLLIKTISAPEQSGLFSIQTKAFQGFQWGDPQKPSARVTAELYATDGSLEFVFIPSKTGGPLRQTDINRVLQTATKSANSHSTSNQHETLAVAK